MKKEKRKQIILMALAFIFIGIGCLNFYYQYNHSIEVAAQDYRNELNLGDVQLVNSEVSNEEENHYVSQIVPNDEIENIENVESEKMNSQVKVDVNSQTTNQSKEQVNHQTNIEVDSQVSNEQNAQGEEQYFVETRLQRDTMYSEMLETYQKMLENPDVGETQKVIAAQEISNINNIKNGVMIAENLIKNKGFENVVVLVNNGSVSIVVKSALLNQEQIAKIQNIVSRELNVELQNINISKK